jgi:hypothetical protein
LEIFLVTYNYFVFFLHRYKLYSLLRICALNVERQYYVLATSRTCVVLGHCNRLSRMSRLPENVCF